MLRRSVLILRDSNHIAILLLHVHAHIFDICAPMIVWASQYLSMASPNL